MNRNLRESLAGGRNTPAISQFRRGNNNNNLSQNGFSRDSDENLDLFSKIRRSFPLSSSDELPDGSFLIHFPFLVILWNFRLLLSRFDVIEFLNINLGISEFADTRQHFVRFVETKTMFSLYTTKLSSSPRFHLFAFSIKVNGLFGTNEEFAWSCFCLFALIPFI